jgi:Transposase IS66 family
MRGFLLPFVYAAETQVRYALGRMRRSLFRCFTLLANAKRRLLCASETDPAGNWLAKEASRLWQAYESGHAPGPILKAACWGPRPRPFFVMADLAENARRKAQGNKPAVISPLALETVRWIDALFEIERTINGQGAERRKASARNSARLLVADLEAWMQDQRAKLSRGNDVAKAMDYMLKRWSAFTRFLDTAASACRTMRRSVACAASLWGASHGRLRVRSRRRGAAVCTA